MATGLPQSELTQPRFYDLLRGQINKFSPEWLDHPLKGEWADYRECHIGGDFLLIYQVSGNAINFVRTGTHAELFE